MSDDGADMGITAERALHAVLGGAPSPERLEGMSPEQMREYLTTAPDSAASYDDTARIAGKIALAHLDAHPEHRLLGNGEYAVTPPGESVDDLVEVEPSLYDTIKRHDPEAAAWFGASGITGFQWGWAENAAKYALGLPPVPNPAIVDIG
jgi:hypothetical protein